eukprot:EG_transcript_1306
MSPLDTLMAISPVCGQIVSGGGERWTSAGALAICLRPTTLPPEALYGVVGLLKQKATCVLAHEQEYGTMALYVHSSWPISELLDVNLLDSLDVQPQRALVFRLHRPYNAGQVQNAMNIYAARHVGINAAVVNENSNCLTVFEDPIGTRVPVCKEYTVRAVFLPGPSEDLAAVQVQPTQSYSAGQELELLKQAFAAHPEFNANKVLVKSAGNTLLFQPHHPEELGLVQRLVVEALQGFGLQSRLKKNAVILHQIQSIVMPRPCEAEIEIWPADDSDGLMYLNLTACDVVQTVLGELSVTGTLAAQRTFGFHLAGVRCAGCAQRLIAALLEELPAEAGCTILAINLSHTVLMATTSADDEATFVGSMLTALRRMEVPSALVFGDDEVVTLAEVLREQQSYLQGTPQCDPEDPSGGLNVVEVFVRSQSAACGPCAAMLRRVLARTIPVRNVVTDPARMAVMVEYHDGIVTLEDITTALRKFGYCPAVGKSGEELFSTFQELLESQFALPSPSSTESDGATASQTTADSMDGTSSYTAKLYPGASQQPVAMELMLIHNPADGAHELFLRDAVGDLQRVDTDMPQMFLENEFTIWYDKVVDRSKPNAPEGTLMELESFKTLQDFWRIWTQFDFTGLQEGDVIMVFRRHVQPNIHHPVNKAGGRWYTRALPLEMRMQLWTGLVLAMLGEFLEDNTNNEVCGVVLSVKPGGDRIEVWVDGDYHHHAKHGTDTVPLHRQLSPTMGDILARVLQLNPGRHRLHYWTHVAYERHRKLHSGSARRDKRKHKMAVTSQGMRPGY